MCGSRLSGRYQPICWLAPEGGSVRIPHRTSEDTCSNLSHQQLRSWAWDYYVHAYITRDGRKKKRRESAQESTIAVVVVWKGGVAVAVAVCCRSAFIPLGKVAKRRLQLDE